MVQIKNSPPVFESIVAAMIAIGFIAAGLYSIVPVVVYILVMVGTIGVTCFAVQKRHVKDGTLSINPETGEFVLNGEKFTSFKEISFYRSELLVGSARMIHFGQSRMIISLGTSPKNFFRISDNRATFLGDKGNTKQEVDALEAFAEGSSLSEDEKASFANWLGRARLMQSEH